MSVDYATNPSTFDKRLTIFAEKVVFDEYNNPKSLWHPFAVVMAAIEPMVGREYWQAAQSQSEGSFRITMRFRKGITDRIRFKYEGDEGVRWFEAKSPPINIREHNQYLEIMCKEVVAND